MVGAAAALMACGGGNGDVPDGQHDLGGGVTVAVHDVVEVPDDPGGVRWVAVDLEYFNRGDDTLDMTLMYAVEMTTSDNREATRVSRTGSELESSRAKTLPAGRSTRVWEAFEVPDGVEPATLTLYGGEIGDDPAVVDLQPG